MATPAPNRPVTELRVALTAHDYDRLVRFYCDGLGLEPADLWTNDGGRAVILDIGKGTLEIFDEAQPSRFRGPRVEFRRDPIAIVLG